jgi:hypothetical protein
VYILHVAYKRGIEKGWLCISYSEFEETVVIGGSRQPRPFYPYNPYYKRRYRPDAPSSKYQKKEHHCPKDDIPDDPWREGKLRDHRKRWARHKGFKYYKKERAISHRAKVRQWVAHERWDNFSQRNVSDRWEYASDTFSLYDWW